MNHLLRLFVLPLLLLALSPFALAGKRPHIPDSLQQLTFTVGDCSFVMQRVEGGSFVMGATSDQHDPDTHTDKPAHLVTLSSYYIASTELTIALWRTVMPEWSTVDEWYDPLHPVNYISYDDCQLFFHRLDSITGMPFRLPTEAEWEYAARGGARSRQYRFAGSNNADEVAWLLSNAGNRRRVVASLSPNELGLYDMSGNLAEWCADWYAPYEIGVGDNPKGPDTGDMRIVRGASYANCVANSHISVRSSYSPDEANSYIGCRLALSLPDDPTVQSADTVLPLSRRLRIGGRRMTFLLVNASTPFYIAETPVTVHQWQKVMETSIDGKGSAPAVGMSRAERLRMVERCRRATGVSLAMAAPEDISLAIEQNLIDTTTVARKKKRWERTDGTIQRHRRNIDRAQIFADLVGYKIKQVDDPVLLAYKRNPEDLEPLRLIIRL